MVPGDHTFPLVKYIFNFSHILDYQSNQCINPSIKIGHSSYSCSPIPHIHLVPPVPSEPNPYNEQWTPQQPSSSPSCSSSSLPSSQSLAVSTGVSGPTGYGESTSWQRQKTAATATVTVTVTANNSNSSKSRRINTDFPGPMTRRSLSRRL